MLKKDFIYIKGSEQSTSILIASKGYEVDFSVKKVYVNVFYDDEKIASISQSIKNTLEIKNQRTVFVNIPITKLKFKKIRVEVLSNEINLGLIGVDLEPIKFVIPQ